MTDQPTDTIEIRSARPDDEPELRRLGELDSARVPPAPVLLAFEGGELRAALSLRTDAAIADPFAPSAPLVKLLRAHAAPPRQRPARGWGRRAIAFAFGVSRP